MTSVGELEFTVGMGLAVPTGLRVAVPVNGNPVLALADALESLETGVERWWSPSLFRDDYRDGARWLSAFGCGIDVDYYDSQGAHATPPAEARLAFKDALESGEVLGNLYHLTPRGGRLVVLLSRQVTDQATWEGAAASACELTTMSLERTGLAATAEIDPKTKKPIYRDGYVVDAAASCDRARLYFTPRAIVKGERRKADIVVQRECVYGPEALILSGFTVTGQPASTLKTTPNKHAVNAVTDLDEAVRRWNSEHPADWPRSADTCPVCKHNGCFGRLPNDQSRWYCFSSNHADGGIKGEKGWHGDALDLEAHKSGLSRIEILRRGGYLTPRASTAGATQTQHKAENPTHSEPINRPSGLEMVLDPNIGEVEYIIPPLVPKDDVTLIAATWKTAKTFITYALTLAAATGRLVFERYKVAAPIRVMIVQLEMPHREDCRRLRRLAIGMGLPPEDVVALALDGWLTFYSRPIMDLSTPEGCSLLTDMAKRAKAELVVVDSVLAAFSAENLNDNASVRRAFTHAFNPLTSAGVSVIALHHYRKSSSQALGKDDAKGQVLGAQAFGAAAGRVYGLERLKQSKGETKGNFRVQLSALGSWTPEEIGDIVLTVKDTEEGSGTTVSAVEGKVHVATLTKVQQAAHNIRNRVQRHLRIGRQQAIAGAMGDLDISERTAASGLDYARLQRWVEVVPAKNSTSNEKDLIPGSGLGHGEIQQDGGEDEAE